MNMSKRRKIDEMLRTDYKFSRYIIVPHPSQKLSKNGRACRHLEIEQKQVAKSQAWAELEGDFVGKRYKNVPKTYRILWFCSTNKSSQPDFDNALCRCKYALDAIAEHFGVDDRDFSDPRGKIVPDDYLNGYLVIAF